ncbi:hypothetical protein [Nonomuraea sp. B1E8]|uniref:hypothetical protein n=1 Tax=unclassified Nonomuraea TaxID=2593643 RepID=UPI00325C8BE2
MSRSPGNHLHEPVEEVNMYEEINDAPAMLDVTRGHHAMSKASFAWEQLSEEADA